MTNGLTETLVAASNFAHEQGIAFALVGGLAVAVHGEPRFTRDVDLAVAVDDDDGAELVVRAAMAEGWEVVATAEQDAVDLQALLANATQQDVEQRDIRS